jgi:hypothetical protein
MILYGILTIVTCFFLMKLVTNELKKPEVAGGLRAFYQYLLMALVVGLIVGLILCFCNVEGTRFGL